MNGPLKELRFLGDGSLVISSASMKHSGRYSCMVSNLAGNDSVVYSLKVLEPPRIVSDVPGTIDVTLGLRLDIPCHATGNPPPIIFWEKDHLQIIPGRDYNVSSTGTLQIDEASLSHGGRYTCSAKSSAGVDTRHTSVIVQEPPRILPEMSSEVTLVEGGTIDIRCLAHASPEPTFEWFRRGRKILGTEDGILLSSNILRLQSAKTTDQGPITCKAINPAGFATVDIRITVIVPPDISEQQRIIEESVLVGGPLSLFCPVTSYPLPKIRWEIDGRQIDQSNTNIQFSEDLRKLTILSARVADAGAYTCIARNAAGETRKTFNIEVLVPPNIDQSKYQRQITAVVNEPVTISCPVTGIPEVTVSWIQNGQLLSEAVRGIQLSPDNRHVIISSVRQDHEGTYTCAAANKAGSLDVDIVLLVIAPPELGEDEVVKVVEGQTLSLQCNPKGEERLAAKFEWLKDNGPIDQIVNIQQSLEGRKVFVKRVRVDDVGTYTCIASNTAGQRRKSYLISVLAPAKFKFDSYERNVAVTEGQTVSLSCEVDGHPFPNITWFQDGKAIQGNRLGNVRLFERNQNLQTTELLNTEIAQLFSCTASNELASVSRDFFVQIIKAPQIENSGSTIDLEVVKDSDVILDCKVDMSSASRNLEIQWLRNGSPVQKANQRLQLKGDGSQLFLSLVDITDAAMYTCQVSNVAGKVTKHFRLTVIAAPAILGEAVENIEIVEGHSLNLQCHYSGSTETQQNWLKDGYQLPFHAQLINDNSTVYVEAASTSDAGHYSCSVTNKAGTSEKAFKVKVVPRPVFSGPTEETVEVTVGNVVKLSCILEKDVKTTIAWHKEGRTLAPRSGTEFVGNNQHLHIATATKDDAGIYSCTTENRAGSAFKRIILTVLAAPRIKGEGALLSVPLNRSLTLSCESDGIPEPVVQWTKDNVDVTQIQQTQVLGSGRFLEITHAAEQHSGRYMCSARNSIGSAEVIYVVDVILPPKIVGNGKDTINVIQNQTAVLRCPIRYTNGKSSKIQWSKDSSPLELPGEKFQILHRGKTLNIFSSQTSDEGSYDCTVTNKAGQTSFQIRLQVNIPPVFLTLEQDRNRSIVEGQSILLNCAASGKPEPTLVWHKDGTRINDGNVNQLFSSGAISGSQLRIDRTRIQDSGKFLCVANNEAGTAEQEMTLYVMTPPRIDQEGIHSIVRAIIREQASIVCPASGRPSPIITWLKDGHKLDLTSSTVYTTSNGQKLHFVSVSQSDVAKYTCVASNEAGEDRRGFTLEPLIAPTISETGARTLKVLLGASAVIECAASGSPEPTNSWILNGKPISESNRVFVRNDGKQLQLTSVTNDDGGRYTCVATNAAGIVDMDTFVEIIEAPRVEREAFEAVEVILSGSVSLKCSVLGTKQMTIDWFKENQPLDNSGQYVQAASKGSQLFILAARELDEGHYECRAKNSAGEARKGFQLTVNVAPVVNQTASSNAIVDGVKGSLASIDCIVKGKPEPSIAWLKDGVPLQNLQLVLQFQLLNNNRTLWISQASNEHIGRYTCRASNKVGTAEKDFVLQLSAPPHFDQLLEVVEVKAGDNAVLSCAVNSSTGAAVLHTHWLINNVKVEPSNQPQNTFVSDRSMELRDVQISNAARYTCVVQNEAGQAHKHFDLSVIEPPRFIYSKTEAPKIIVGNRLILDCSVVGVPRPNIRWTKDGLDLYLSSDELVNDAQQLVFASARADHAGRYTCVAENKAGRTEKELQVEILEPPEILSVENRIVEVAENDSAILFCPVANKRSSSEIQWSKEGRLLTPSRELQFATGKQKLHIVKARTHHSGQYECVVQNEAGTSSLILDLVVYVPPRVIGDTVRTMQAVVNHSIDIDCQAVGNPEPKIEWYHADLPVESSDRISLYNNGSILRIHSVQPSHDGRYSCIASNKAGNYETDTFLQVLIPPTVSAAETNLKVAVGQAQMIRCSVHGTPPPSVTWLKNGEQLDIAQSHSHVLHYLHLLSAKLSDNGVYVCVARNRAGEDRVSINLQVLVPPAITSADRVLNVTENGTLLINCSTEGYPLPEVEWFKDDEKLDERSATNYRLQGTRLTILSAMSNNAGKYTCKARNEAGFAQADFAIDVYIPPHLLQPGTQHVSVKEGESVIMECNVESRPTAEFQWQKSGRTLSSNPSIVFSPHGHRLLLLKATRADSGSYTCVARNVAGEVQAEFIVTVLVTPYFSADINQNPVSVLNQATVLSCPAEGVPDPKIEWLREGQLITELELDITVTGRELKISNTKHEHSGRFTCHASNDAGSIDMEFILEVLAPPRPGSEVPPQIDYFVIREESVQMECPIEASPRLELTWLKGDSPVYLERNTWISADGRYLTVSKASLEDGGRYACKATNIAGSTEIPITLHVLSPPQIDSSNIVDNPLGIVNRSISFDCLATGTPAPVITWSKEGLPIPENDRITYASNNQTLTILRILQEDSGLYTCLAVNRAGQVQQDFHFEVLSPPVLDRTGKTSVVVVEGDALSLVCPVLNMLPFPEIIWTKDLRPISEDSRITISTEQQKIQLERATIADAGSYVCIASNRAGESRFEYVVNVYSLPEIDDTQNDPMPHVNQGETLTLWCIIRSGNPEPTIVWQKDGIEISTADDRVQFTSDRTWLRITSATPEDAGRYSCIVANQVGTNELVLLVDVWVAPSVNVSGPPSANVGSTVQLQCNAMGNPEPTMQWLRNGQFIADDTESAATLHISKDSRMIEIQQMLQEHVGRYTCIARNDAGVSEASLSLEISIPPIIRRENMETEPRLQAGRTLTLHCPADPNSNPPPVTIWSKDGQPVEESERVQIVNNGEFLQVHAVAVTDSGLYKCHVSNMVGEDTIEFNVDILEPPSISRGGVVQVIEGQDTELFCDAKGRPEPEVSWQRNGHKLATGDRYTVTQKTLRIEKVRNQDAGIYVCVASNELGHAQQAYTLEVLVPPKIKNGRKQMVQVPMGQMFRLYCLSSGYPEPTVNWSKEGNPLEGRERTSIHHDGTLEISNAQPFDTGDYHCLVSNSAGQNVKTYEVHVIEPPRLSTEFAIINVTQGDSVTMHCDVVANAAPTFTWTKNGGQLTESPRFSIDDSSLLRISNSSVLDSGDYACIAENIAGKSTKRFRLNVFIPPSVSDGPSVVEAVEGARTDLICTVVGSTPITVTWSKDGANVSDAFRTGTFLVFPSVKQSDAGVYSCRARNWAGEAMKQLELVVLVPPKIFPERQNVTVREGSTAFLECNATGFQDPAVDWYQIEANDKIMEDEKFEFVGRALQINQVNSSDDQFYRCVATNKAGVAVGYRRLTVLEKLKIIWVECENGEPKSKTTYIRNRGDVPTKPDAILPWRDEIMELPTNGTNNTIIKCLPESENGRLVPKQTTDNVTAIRAPVLVTLPKTQNLYETENLELLCAADGSPSPEIIWFLNGKSISEQPASIKGESFLKIRNVTRSKHEGTYLCVARNEAGATRAAASVRIKSGRPYQAEPGTIKELFGEVTLLSCDLSARVNENIRWLLNGKLIEEGATDRSVQILQNGSLLVFSQAEGHQYQCAIGELNDHKGYGIVKAVKHFVKPTTAVPVVKIHPKKLNAYSGSSAQFSCVHNADSVSSHVQWYRSGVPVVQQCPRVCPQHSGHLTLQDVSMEDSGTYSCRVIGTAGTGEDTAVLMVQAYGLWSDWTEFASCSGTCFPAYKTRSRECLDPVNSRLLNVEQCSGTAIDVQVCKDLPLCTHIHSDRRRRSINRRSVYGAIWNTWSSWSECSRSCSGGHQNRHRYCHIDAKHQLSMLNAASCDGPGFEVQRCKDNPCVDAYPIGLTGTLSGKVNNFKIEADVSAAVTVREEDNEIIYTIENLTEDIGAETIAQIGMFATPCWALSYSASPSDKNGYSLSKGDKLLVRQRALGQSSDGYLQLDVMMNGSTPSVPSRSSTVVDGYTETYVHSSNGRWKGAGSSVLRSGSRRLVPFTVEHEIQFQADALDEKEAEAASVLPTKLLTISPVHLSGESATTLRRRFEQRIQTSTVAAAECPPGYVHTGVSRRYCDDVNECVEFPQVCRQKCVNMLGTYRCECFPGFYAPFQGECMDVNECAISVPCSGGQQCVNAIGSYKCVGDCASGYVLNANGSSCIDVDECKLGLYSCETGTTCINRPGTYECIRNCPIGYRMRDDGSCSDIDECFELIPCHPTQTCFNTVGSYRCACPPGFTDSEDSSACKDVDECYSNPGLCEQFCHNTLGSFFCYCQDGFRLHDDGRSCFGISTSEVPSMPEEFEARDSPVICAEGQQWNGYSCASSVGINPCGAGVNCQYRCVNTHGRFHCECPAGYLPSDDGLSCEDIDECRTGSAGCQISDLCLNERGSYHCIPVPCPHGYVYNVEASLCQLHCHVLGMCPEMFLKHPKQMLIRTVSLASGVPANQSMLRLAAFDRNGHILRHSRYTMRDHSMFSIETKHGRGIVYSTVPLTEAGTYKIRARATSHSVRSPRLKFQTDFLIYISVSNYPF